VFPQKTGRYCQPRKLLHLSASLEVEPFNRTLENLEHPHEIGPAFSACAFAAISFAEEPLMREDRQIQDVRYVFEKGDRENEIAKTFGDWSKSNSKLYGHRGYGFEPKKLTLLQPADLIAGIVQRCMIRTYAAFPCLENGKSRTPLINFERHYSEDGVTFATVSGHDESHCWVVNPKSFTHIDGISTRLFSEYPNLLQKRLKHTQFKPKRKAGNHDEQSRIRAIQQNDEEGSQDVETGAKQAVGSGEAV
jgi:hypothetical protein